MDRCLQTKASSREFWMIVSVTYGIQIIDTLLSCAVWGFQQHILLTDRRLLWGTGMQIGLIGLVSWYLSTCGWKYSDFKFVVSWHQILEGIGFYILNLAIYQVWTGFLLQIPAVHDSVRPISFEHHVTLPVAMAVTIVNPLFEEFLNLGYVQQCLAEHGAAFAVGVAVLLRLLSHIYQGPVAVLLILPMGVLFSLYFLFRRQLCALVIAHALLDFIPLVSRV